MRTGKGSSGWCGRFLPEFGEVYDERAQSRTWPILKRPIWGPGALSWCSRMPVSISSARWDHSCRRRMLQAAEDVYRCGLPEARARSVHAGYYSEKGPGAGLRENNAGDDHQHGGCQLRCMRKPALRGSTGQAYLPAAISSWRRNSRAGP